MAKRSRSRFVRTAGPQDAAQFAAFLISAWRDAGTEAPGFAGATEASIAAITEENAYLAMIENESLTLQLAWVGDAVVGFAALRLLDANDTVELAGIVVSAEYAGQGIGRDLVDACLASPIAQRASTVAVRTEATNTRAQGFYTRLGFTDPIPCKEDVDGVIVDVVEMTRQLD